MSDEVLMTGRFCVKDWMVKAIHVTREGNPGSDPGVIKMSEVTVPAVRDDEGEFNVSFSHHESCSAESNPRKHSISVLIETRSISINPIDYKLITGAVPGKGKFPRKTGTDVAGVIIEAGAAVKGLKAGDNVFSNAIGSGPMSERFTVNASKVSLMPATVTFAEAASFPLAGQTALQGEEVKQGHTTSIHPHICRRLHNAHPSSQSLSE